jgi:hypothetical protein
MKYLIQKSKTSYKKSSFNTYATYEGEQEKSLEQATSMYNLLYLDTGFRKRLIEQTNAGMTTILREDGDGLS